MALTVGEIVGVINLEDRSFHAKLNKAEGGFTALGGKIRTGLGAAAAAAGAAIVGLGIAGVTTGVKTAAALQQSEVAFTTLLGSTGKAKSFLADLSAFATKTPFELPGLVDASRMLVGVGQSANSVIPTLTALGNTSGALGLSQESFSRVMIAVTQTMAKGKIQAEELMQITEAGIPIWKILSSALGLPVPAIQKLSSEGKLLADDVWPKVFKQMNKNYGGAMEAQSKTLAGVWSTFMDTLKIGLADSIMPLVPALSSAVPQAAEIMGSALRGIATTIQTLIPAVGGVIGFFTQFQDILVPLAAGITAIVAALKIYKGTLAAISLAAKAYTAVQTALNIVLAANPIGLIILAVVGLVAALVVAYKKSETFRNIVNSAFRSIKTIVMAVFNFLKAYFTTMFNVYKTIFMTAFNAIKSVVMIVFNVLKAYFTTMFNVYKTIFMTALNAIRAVWESVWKAFGPVVKAVFALIKSVIELAMAVISLVIRAGIMAIKAVWIPVWNAIKTATSTVWNFIKNTITTVINFLKPYIIAALNIIKNVTTTVWNAVKRVVSTVVNSIRSTVTGAFNAVKNIVTSVFNAINNTIGGKIRAAYATIKNVVNQIRNFFSGAKKWLLNAGKNIIQGLIDGITSKIKALTNSIKKVTDKVSKFLPGSPVREGALRVLNRGYAGGQIVDMLARGIRGRVGELVAATRRAAGAASLPVRLPLTVSGAAGAALPGSPSTGMGAALRIEHFHAAPQHSVRRVAEDLWFLTKARG